MILSCGRVCRDSLDSRYNGMSNDGEGTSELRRRAHGSGAEDRVGAEEENRTGAELKTILTRSPRRSYLYYS
ncbi:unnamed protein product [Nippostrongylus brasiliensis]|uniref:Uncharacterized protein n=1 Tax=Nippostrongylus brasiliensis TaxID=27835 RepID=A0A0N4XID7_NIPBR|nr:unnamed protein product [Nippostrongylus brasiliensis]